MAKSKSAAKKTTAKKSAAKKTTAKKSTASATKRGATKRTTATSAARPKARAGAKPARRTAGARAAVLKGNLEVGDRRRETGGVGAALPPAAAREPRGQVSSTQLPGEKAVPSTDASLPVEPPERDGDDEPMDEAAIDRRRQIVGTDDRRGRGS